MTAGIGNSVLNLREIPLDRLKSFPESDEDTIRFYLVRHGESALNVDQQGKQYVQGQSPSVPLTERGASQADALAKKMFPRMQGKKFTIVSSPARRAFYTAIPLADRLKQEPVVNEKFLELGSGEWEGRDKQDPEYLAEYHNWQIRSAHQKFFEPKLSTGESYSQVALRALQGLSEIYSKLEQNETVFIFSHSLLINAVVLSLTHTELSHDAESPLPECIINHGDMVSLEIPRNGRVKDAYVRGIIRSNLSGMQPKA